MRSWAVRVGFTVVSFRGRNHLDTHREPNQSEDIGQTIHGHKNSVEHAAQTSLRPHGRKIEPSSLI